MKGPNGRASLEAGLQYRFRDSSLLDLALTHGSAGRGEDNQRLEYLGDALLNFCVARLIFRELPTWPEGAMSKLRGMLVCTDALHHWADDLGLQLNLGARGPKQPSALRKPLADAVEALIAAIYIDNENNAGVGLTPVLALVERRFLHTIRAAHLGMWEASDSKTTLQERAAAHNLLPPSYELVERQGPDHRPTFTVRVQVGELQAQASAGSLKQAEILAARHLLGTLDTPQPKVE